MSERLPIRLVLLLDAKGALVDGNDAAEPPADTVDDDQGSTLRPHRSFWPRLPVLRARTLRQGQILEAGLPRASQKETGPCGPVPKQTVETLAAQLSFWMYWPLSHSYIT
jgi:hypothetical protein